MTHDDLGCASYIVGDESAGVAAVVDPKLDIDEYLILAGPVAQRRRRTASRPSRPPNTMLRAGFGSKLARLAEMDQDVVFIGRDDEDGRRAAELVAAVGITRIAGYLSGGMTAWREEKRDVQRTERLTLPALHELWEANPDTVQVLDVREQSEWDAGHIPGAVHGPYHDIRALPAGIDPDRPVGVVCGSGQRAAVGASLAQRYGARNAIHVVEGGVPMWNPKGWPIEQPDSSSTT